MLKYKLFSPSEGNSGVSKGSLKEKNKSERIAFSTLILHSGKERITSSFLEGRIGTSISNGHVHGKCEDAGFVSCKNSTIYLGVFDGVSGNLHGRFASRLFSETAIECISAGKSVKEALRLSEARLHDTNKWKEAPERVKPACTMLVAKISPDGKAEITWLGDSFALAFLDTGSSIETKQLTVPHEKFWNMHANEAKSASITLRSGDRLLLASDGLDFFDKKEIGLEAFSFNNMSTAADNLVKIAEERSSPEARTGIRGLKIRTDSFGKSSVGKADDRIAIIYRHE